MAEMQYASNGKGNLGVTLGSLGLGFGLLGSMFNPNCGRGWGFFGNNNCGCGNGYGFNDGFYGYNAGAFGPYGNNRTFAFPNYHVNSEDEFVTRYDAAKEQEIAKLEQELSLCKADKLVDQKGLEIYTYFDTWRRQFESKYNDQMTMQAVYNATNQSNINCLTGRVNTLEGLTKTIIPYSSICPEPMSRYNSWTAPTTPAATTPTA